MKTKKYSKGFTLVELLVVIAIIGILAAVVLMSLSRQRRRAVQSNVVETAKSVLPAIVDCYLQGDTRYVGAVGGNASLPVGFGSPVCSSVFNSFYFPAMPNYCTGGGWTIYPESNPTNSNPREVSFSCTNSGVALYAKCCFAGTNSGKCVPATSNTDGVCP